MPFSSLSPQNWPFGLEWLPETAYLVGGAVRNAFLSGSTQQEYLDLDFVLPTEPVETARKIARHYGVGFVLLDPERQIARVVFREATVDFAPQVGENLVKDLHRRDFTVNAIAYNPKTEAIIDPLGGRLDLKRGVMRMVAKTNLEDDPLRLLRAYRQAAQLNFTMDPLTRATIRSLAGQLGTVAAERVQTELGYLLKKETGNKWLAEAYRDGLFQFWLVNVTPEKLQQVAKIDAAANMMIATWPQLNNYYSSCLKMAKLASLVSERPSEAEVELLKLKYSRAEIRSVVTALRVLPQLLLLETPLSLKEQYFFFVDVGDVFPIVAVLGVANSLGFKNLAPLMNRYLDPLDIVAHPQPLVTGKDIMTHLNLPPSPKIGELLTEVQLARIEGKITTREEALEFAHGCGIL